MGGYGGANHSLSELATVMTAMKQQQHKRPAMHGTPGFRDSALTSLLRHSLGGDCKVRFASASAFDA
jgi:hypothetical protein